MNIETKKFEIVEIYVEDISLKAVYDFVKEKHKDGYNYTTPTTHYGKSGKEEDKMWWSKLSKKVEII